MFAIERPFAFFGILFLAPAIATVFFRYHVISQNIGIYTSKHIQKYKLAILAKMIFRSIAWIMLVASFAGISWGTRRVAVQKSGNAVSFVFDISYSMNAADEDNGMTRLEAAANYANMLLERMDGTAVSVVLAKGDGIIAIPLTEDTASISSLLPVLSPTLMTAPGTSLGRGITAALKSFPADSAQASHVWIFTDGEETDGFLASALNECEKRGVSVVLIGFGGTQEVQVLSGDGTTTVMTALRSLQLERLTNSRVSFVNASAQGSAVKLLEKLKMKTEIDGSHGTPVVYETQPVPRHRLFLTLAVLFFILGVIANFLFSSHKKFRTKHLAVLFLCCCFYFSSCGVRFDSSKEIFYGTWNYQQKNYQEAAGHFLSAAFNLDAANESSEKSDAIKQYALYGLATTYFAAQEYEAASIRLSQIAPDAPPRILYAASYEQGIIAYQNGNYEAAVIFFRNALKVDASQIDAKINLEITTRQLKAHNARAQEQEMIPVTQNENRNNEMERAIFERIRENDIQRWKNSELPNTQSDVLDY